MQRSPAPGARPPSLLPPGRGAGARQAAAARTCSRKPEQLGAAVREARARAGKGRRGGGAEGRRRSWHQPAPSEEGSARAAPPGLTRVRGVGEKTECGLGGRDGEGLGGTNCWNKGKGACFPGFGTKKVGGTQGRADGWELQGAERGAREG